MINNKSLLYSRKNTSPLIAFPKILIINPCNWFNKGDVTNRLGLVLALKEELGKDVNITLESATLELDSQYFGKYNNVEVIKGLFALSENENTFLRRVKPLFFFSLFLLTILSKTFRNLLLKAHILDPELKRTLLRYHSSEIIISAPGGFLSDNYVISSLIPNLLELLLAKLLRKKVIIYAQSIGPFNSQLWMNICGFILNRIDAILLREHKSRFWLEKMNIRSPPVYVTADSTFSIYCKMVHLKKIEHVRRKNLAIGITLASGWVSNQEKEITYLKYLRSLACFIDYAIKSLNANVYILPQTIDKRDFEAAMFLKKTVKNKSGLYVNNNDYTPEDLMGIIEGMDILIGTRMHSNILALLMCVPTLCISYEHKGEGIMEAMGLEQFVINMNDLTCEVLIHKANNLIAQKEALKSVIEAKVLHMYKRSMANARIVKLFWSKYGSNALTRR